MVLAAAYRDRAGYHRGDGLGGLLVGGLSLLFIAALLGAGQRRNYVLCRIDAQGRRGVCYGQSSDSHVAYPYAARAGYFSPASTKREIILTGVAEYSGAFTATVKYPEIGLSEFKVSVQVGKTR